MHTRRTLFYSGIAAAALFLWQAPAVLAQAGGSGSGGGRSGQSGQSGGQQTPRGTGSGQQGTPGGPQNLPGIPGQQGAPGQQSGTNAARPGGARLTNGDMTFVAGVLMDGRTDRKLADMAKHRAHNREVRRLAEQIVADQRRTQEDLDRLMTRLGIRTSLRDEAIAKQTVDKLARRDSTEFDRAFVHHLLVAQADQIKRFRGESRVGNAPALRDFAVKHLPPMEKRLEILRDLEKQLNPQGPSGEGQRLARPGRK